MVSISIHVVGQMVLPTKSFFLVNFDAKKKQNCEITQLPMKQNENFKTMICVAKSLCDVVAPNIGRGFRLPTSR